MRPNPGGHISASEVVGRDVLIRRLWAALEQQSVVLVAERRIGKTTVVRKMVADAAEGVLPLWMDVEGLRTPLEFAQAVFDHLRRRLPKYRRAAHRVHQFLERYKGTSIGPVTIPAAAAREWKPLLESIFGDLVAVQADEYDRVVLIFDELPLMLQKIVHSASEETAVDLLDTLRACRQTHPTLRMVYTGSVGLHHVVRRLRDAHYVGSPMNDMLLEEVPVLDLRHATRLAALLLEGAGVVTDGLDGVAQAIAGAVDGHPFLIHHLARELARAASVEPAAVEATVRQCLTDGQDRWDMGHFAKRIAHYYTEAEQPIVRAVLDALAASSEPLSVSALLQAVKAVVPIEGDEPTRGVLDLMRRDHYLQTDESGRYDFKLFIVKRWWRLDRGIES